MPRIGGEVALPPLAQNTWFTFNSGNDVTEQNQFEAMESMARIGVESYGLDADWFEGGWPGGAGSWVPKAEAFPRGLKPVGDAAREQGRGLVLWFEPERVNPASRIAKEHPEWVLRAGGGDGLFNLGDSVRVNVTAPPNMTATAILPTGTTKRVESGRHEFTIPQRRNP